MPWARPRRDEVFVVVHINENDFCWSLSFVRPGTRFLDPYFPSKPGCNMQKFMGALKFLSFLIRTYSTYSNRHYPIKKSVELPSFDLGTSRMLSARSTN